MEHPTFIISNNVLSAISTMIAYSNCVETTTRHIRYLMEFLFLGMYLDTGRALITKSMHCFCNIQTNSSGLVRNLQLVNTSNKQRGVVVGWWPWAPNRWGAKIDMVTFFDSATFFINLAPGTHYSLHTTGEHYGASWNSVKRFPKFRIHQLPFKDILPRMHTEYELNWAKTCK